MHFMHAMCNNPQTGRAPGHDVFLAKGRPVRCAILSELRLNEEKHTHTVNRDSWRKGRG